MQAAHLLMLRVALTVVLMILVPEAASGEEGRQWYDTGWLAGNLLLLLPLLAHFTGLVCFRVIPREEGDNCLPIERLPLLSGGPLEMYGCWLVLTLVKLLHAALVGACPGNLWWQELKWLMSSFELHPSSSTFISLAVFLVTLTRCWVGLIVCVHVLLQLPQHLLGLGKVLPLSPI